MLHEHAPDGLRSGRLRLGMTSDPPVESGEQIRLRSNYNRLTLPRRDRAASFLWNLSFLRHGGTVVARKRPAGKVQAPATGLALRRARRRFNTSLTARR